MSKQVWEGFVVEVYKDTFQVRMFQGDEEQDSEFMEFEKEFLKEDLSEEELSNLRKNRAFELTVDSDVMSWDFYDEGLMHDEYDPEDCEEDFEEWSEW